MYSGKTAFDSRVRQMSAGSDRRSSSRVVFNIRDPAYCALQSKRRTFACHGMDRRSQPMGQNASARATDINITNLLAKQWRQPECCKEFANEVVHRCCARRKWRSGSFDTLWQRVGNLNGLWKPVRTIWRPLSTRKALRLKRSLSNRWICEL